MDKKKYNIEYHKQGKVYKLSGGTEFMDKKLDEFVERKAKELWRIASMGLDYDEGQDFIRTMLSEAPMRKPRINMQYLHDEILCPHCKRYETKTIYCDYCGEEIKEVTDG